MERIGVQKQKSEVDIHFRRQRGATRGVCTGERQDLSCSLDTVIWKHVPGELEGQTRDAGTSFSCPGLSLLCRPLWPLFIHSFLYQQILLTTYYIFCSLLGVEDTVMS